MGTRPSRLGSTWVAEPSQHRGVVRSGAVGLTCGFPVSAGRSMYPAFLDAEEARGSNPLAPTDSLDLDEPITGWESALLERGVEIVDDDLGRPCVRREVLGDLLREERERLARIAAESAARAAAPGPPVPASRPSERWLSARVAHGQRSRLWDAAGRVRKAGPRFLDELLEEGQRHQAAVQAEAESKKAAGTR
jgi:hypothetical protein